MFSWLGAAGAALVVALALAAPHVQSQGSSTPITGWMWSDNIGWVSLNCSSDPTGCSKAGVGAWGISLNAGAVSGYAWSDNIGWIKFGGLSGFPAGGSNATFAGGAFSGWARACAGTTSGTCSTMASRTDGWDGWISLSGTSPAYQADTDTNASYLPQTSGAWGSDVVGWLAGNIDATCTPTTKVCTDSTHYSDYTDSSCVVHPAGACSAGSYCIDGGCIAASIGACLSVGADPGSPLACAGEVSSGRVDSGGTATIYWEAIPSTLDSCTLRRGSTAVSSGPLSGSVQTPVITSGSLTYTLTCTLGGDVVVTKTAYVGLVPVFEER